MKVKVLRQVTPFSESYWETFSADVTGETSVAALIDHINYNDDIVDESGNPTTRIGWECSCLQGVCGACAMVINGVPSLACETFVKDLVKDFKNDTITIKPLQKFPVIHDLVIDRTGIFENLKKTSMYIGEYNPKSERKPSKRKKEFEHQYAASKCLKCGLCLEVCPNYSGGENFFGALFANDCYMVTSRNADKSAQIKKQYDVHFASGCSKSLSCMDVCPMGIPTIASIAKMNRK